MLGGWAEPTRMTRGPAPGGNVNGIIDCKNGCGGGDEEGAGDGESGVAMEVRSASKIRPCTRYPPDLPGMAARLNRFPFFRNGSASVRHWRQALSPANCSRESGPR